jgi:hypothetical protein
MISQVGLVKWESMRQTSEGEWRSFNEENKKLSQNSISKLKTLNAPYSHELKNAWSHMTNYG